MRGILVSVALGVMLTGGANAEPVRVLPYGTNPCGDFVAASHDEQVAYAAWALGFISGLNWRDTGQ